MISTIPPSPGDITGKAGVILAAAVGWSTAKFGMRRKLKIIDA
jgi:hypothetical protein